MADDLQEMLAKIGRAGKLTLKARAGSEFWIEGRKSVRKHDVFVVYERSDFVRGPLMRDKYLNQSRVRKQSYSGLVWCVTTPLGTIYTRRNGVPMWSGNSDDSSICPISGRQVMPLEVYHGLDNVELAGRVKAKAEKVGARKVFVDEIGTGSGVVDVLKHEKVKAVHGVNVATKSRKPRKFADLRSELGWALREALNPADPEPLGLPYDMELVGELSVIKYEVDRQGRIRVESKDEIKKRLGRSPDRADSVILARAAAAFSAAVPSAGATPGGGPSTSGPRDRGRGSGGGGMQRLRDRFGMKGRRRL